MISAILYAFLGKGPIIQHQAYVSSKDSYKLSQIMNNPELLKQSLIEDLSHHVQDEKKQSLLVSVCMHLSDYSCAKEHAIWLIKNYPKDSYFIYYLQSQMKLNHNQLSQNDRKLVSAFLSRKFDNIAVHRIAAQDAMAHKEYAKATTHWRYVLDHLEAKDPNRDLLEKAYSMAVKKAKENQ